MDKKAQIEPNKILTGISIILVGFLGVLFLALGVVFSNNNSIFIGKIIIGLMSLAMLFLERLLKW